MYTPFVLFLGDIGGSELMLIMVVILVFFGANKIPELARGLGKGIREFKDASREIRSEFEQVGQAPQPQNPYAQPAPQQFSPVPDAPAPIAETPAPVVEHDPAPPVAPALPPNLAPEGTQPRQPYIPASPDA
jgi:sec-independent protein translocase protein TatA